MTYIREAQAALREASEDGYQDENEQRLLELYTLLVLVKGEDVTLEDVHDAWSIWRSRTRPDHPSIVPFDHLSTEIQELDEPYAQAIREAAQKGAPMKNRHREW